MGLCAGVRSRCGLKHQQVPKVRGPGQEKGCNIGVIIGDVRLAAVMHDVTRIADHVAPLAC